MPAENDFLPFAVGGGANVVAQATYAAAAALLANGFQAGLAESAYLNKVWRQSSVMAAVLAQLIVDETGQTAIDDGSTATLLANLKLAIQQAATTDPARIITSSANFNILTTDFSIGLNRTAGLAATQASLPNGALVGQEFEILDLVGNFNGYPITVVPPAGTISGRVNWVLNEDHGGGRFRYFGTNLWGVMTL